MEKIPGDLLEQALKLPNEARAAMAASLLESLDENTDADADTRWALAIANRRKELDWGAVIPIPVLGRVPRRA